MGNLFQFKALQQLTVEDNMSAFIHKCRNELTVFGQTLNWEAHIWPKVAVFAKLGVTTRKPKPDQLMQSSFIDFAKAYFRYQQGHKPTGTKNELKALRAIEAALLQVNKSADISGLTYTVLDVSAELARQYYSGGSAYQCGREIERLAKFITQHNLITNDLSTWKNPLSRPEDTVKTGAEAKKARETKLPNEIALNALAEIFANNPDNQRDVFTTSIFAMLMSAPSRISEILALPVDCEVTEIDSKGVERYGWRFYSGKGFEADIKWIPTVMVEVAKTAIQRVTQLTADARKLAKWIENNPDMFYRHANCPKVSNDTPLSSLEVCQALGLKAESARECKTALEAKGLNSHDGYYTLSTLWQVVIENLPNNFPWYDQERGIKYSQALFILNINQLHGKRGLSPVGLHKPDATFFNNDLNPRLALGDAHKSIFDRHGYFSESGDRLKITSHQARHLLNTIAQRGGLSNLEIAKWSGRADVKQNRTYNHMTEYEFVAMAEQIDPNKGLFGPLGDVAHHLPVTPQEFNTLERAAVHVTEYGYCVHDYTMSPCEKFRDCINCTEQVCIKGNTEKLQRLEERLSRTEQLISNAGKSSSESDMGADRWLQYHIKTAKRLRELISILESSDIQDGAQVKLRGNDFSQLRRIAEKKSAQIKLEDKHQKPDEAAMLEDLTTMLGGGFG